MSEEVPEAPEVPTLDQEIISLASAYLTGLTAGANFSVPAIDLSGSEFAIPPRDAVEIPALTEAALTSREPKGSGMFDALMQSLRAHLAEEHEKGRITGAQYAEVYVSASAAALSGAIQYLLSKDQSRWQAAIAERQAAAAEAQVVTARLSVEEAKVRLSMAHIEAEGAKVDYALKKQSLALAGVSFETAELQRDTASYNLAYILPAQQAGLVKDNEIKAVEKTRLQYEVSDIQPTQKLGLAEDIAMKQAQKAQVLYETASVLPEQVSKLTKENQILTYQLTNQLPAQVAGLTADNLSKDYTNTFLLPAQLKSLNEQTEGHRAKTLDTRSDGLIISGAMGIQKALQQQQIVSYQRDAENKAVRMMFDTWTTQKSIDEALTAPSSVANPNIDSVFVSYLTNLGLRAQGEIGGEEEGED